MTGEAPLSSLADLAARVPDGAKLAAALRETGVLETGEFVRPPLYFVLLAAIGSVGDLLGLGSTLAVRLLQSLAGVVAAIPVYRTANRLGGVRVARFAAGVRRLEFSGRRLARASID